MSDTENIEEYLNNIVGELSKLNKHLAKGYRVRCDKCGDELYVSKKWLLKILETTQAIGILNGEKPIKN